MLTIYILLIIQFVIIPNISMARTTIQWLVCLFGSPVLLRRALTINHSSSEHDEYISSGSLRINIC